MTNTNTNTEAVSEDFVALLASMAAEITDEQLAAIERACPNIVIVDVQD